MERMFSCSARARRSWSLRVAASDLNFRASALAAARAGSSGGVEESSSVVVSDEASYGVVRGEVNVVLVLEV
jgi:hypothetical protein